MRESSQSLALEADTSAALKALADVERRLLEHAPELGSDVIHDHLLRALHERAVFTTRSTLGTGNDVIRLEVVLDASLVFEIVAAALGALDADGISHG